MLSYEVTLKNNRLNQIASTIGTAPVIKFYSSSAAAVPAIGSAATGTLIATLTLPSTWLTTASGGVVSKVGTWTGTASATAPCSGYFRIMNSAQTTTYIQGYFDGPGGALGFIPDITMNSDTVTSGQPFTIDNFSISHA